MNHYGSDLAFIHDDGFGQFAAGGAQELLEELSRIGISAGTVLDIGCGSGITARLLTDAGYSVVGVDLSEPFIRIARQKVPQATFRVGSFVDMELPPCVAACAIGEVLNYSFDDRNNAAARLAFFKRVYCSLADVGVFLLDMAGPDRAPNCSTRKFIYGEGWTVRVEVSAESGVLCRRIESYRRTDGRNRRDLELHKLHLISPDEVASDLRSSGFAVKEISRYGDQPLPRGLHGFLACKRSGASQETLHLM